MRAYIAIGLALCTAASSSTPCLAQNAQLRLQGNQFWVGLASGASADEAIGLAKTADVAETVRKLIYQQFAGREVASDEPVSDVVLEDDETLEGYDSSIAKVTCAVSYSFKPRALIGRLAEDGNMTRAATLGRLSRLRGGIVAGRVRYTVKPTVTAGTSYIELLP